LAVLRVLLEGKILDQSRRMGEYLQKGLEQCKERRRLVREVRGLGLLQAMELDCDARAVVSDCLARGLLINCTNDRVLRFVPPLIISEREIDRLLDGLSQVLGKQVTSPH
jgi:acetylornithine aminotransferase